MRHGRDRCGFERFAGVLGQARSSTQVAPD
jgi:hypothetical protein